MFGVCIGGGGGGDKCMENKFMCNILHLYNTTIRTFSVHTYTVLLVWVSNLGVFFAWGRGWRVITDPRT